MKIAIALLAVLLLAPAAFAQTASEVAKEVLTAYKKEDLAGVKKHTAPMIAAAMDDKFFEDKEIKTAVAGLQSWNGKVKEVRYFKTKMGVMAAAHYDDADKDTYRVLDLINAGYGWKQMGLGTVKKKKFLTYEKKAPELKKDEKAAKESPKTPGAGLKDQLGALGFGFGKKKDEAAAPGAPADQDAPNKGYAIEMADGSKADAPSVYQLKQMLAGLSADNFFLTLTGPQGFMQAAYTAKGLDMEYKDASAHFSSEAPVTPETGAEMFGAYLMKDPAWKGKCKWKPLK